MNIQSFANNRSVEAEDGHLQLFAHDITNQVVYEFMRLMPDATSSTHQHTILESTLLTLASLYTFIATARTGFGPEKWTGRVGTVKTCHKFCSILLCP